MTTWINMTPMPIGKPWIRIELGSTSKAEWRDIGRDTLESCFGEARMKLQQRCRSMELWGLRMAGNPTEIQCLKIHDFRGVFFASLIFSHPWHWCDIVLELLDVLAVLDLAVSPLICAEKKVHVRFQYPVMCLVDDGLQILFTKKTNLSCQLAWNVSCEYWSKCLL